MQGVERLDDHLGIGKDRHEVRVAVPARHDVPVQVTGHSGAWLYGVHTQTLGVLLPAHPKAGDKFQSEDVPKIKAPLLLHYAGKDDGVNQGWPAFEAALKANGVKYQMFMYAGTNHGFHNDTTPRYDDAAAKLAWSRTIAFLKENLKA